MSQRIAIIGAGISGLSAAWYLAREHQVTVFEKNDYLGGHTCTVPVSRPHGDYQVDVGFIVFNDRTYPHYLALLDELGIARQPTKMGFAVSDQRNGLEYSGDGLGGVFAQKRNLFRPGHWRLIADILRFNRQAPGLLDSAEGELPLGEYLRRHHYSEAFRRDYILAMGGAIWSCSLAQMEAFPARFFVRFFQHHGLLSLTNRPQWYVVPGGSQRYVEALVAACPAQFQCGVAVQQVRRLEQGVAVMVDAEEQVFDQVIMACHSDQARQLLANPDEQEAQALAALDYQPNEVVLHTDRRLLPKNERVWSSWNALLFEQEQERIQVTYNMNILQGIDAPETFCVTLNASDRIAEQTVLARFQFDHPLFTPASVAAREALLSNNGRGGLWYAGAWCRNGFHEDGVYSALQVVDGIRRGA